MEERFQLYVYPTEETAGYSPDPRVMEMHRAAKAGDMSSVLSYIASGTDVDARDSLDATCLYWAVSKHHENLVATLLDRGADANAKTKWGSTALHAAADRGFLKIAESLLEYGASTNSANSNADTPLHMACMRGHLAVIRLLVLNGGAELNVKNQQGRTPLDEADGNGMTQVTSFLTAMMQNASRRQGSSPVTCQPMAESMGNIQQPGKSGQLEVVGTSNKTVDLSETKDTKIQHSSAPKEDALHKEKFEILRLDHQRLVQEKALVEEELRNTKGDLVATRQKLNYCQSKLEDTAIECEALHKQVASLTLPVHSGVGKPRMKSKVHLSEGAVGQTSRRVLQPAVFAALLEAVSVEKFQVAQALLSSCIKAFEAPYGALQHTLITKASHQWELNKDFEIIGDGPFNRKADGQLEGSCSLVFRIRHVKFGVLVLKMMNNLINMLQSNHGIGFSATPWLRAQFGAEHDIPLTLPPSPYVLPVIHHYQGSTTPFHQYLKFLVPQQFDVPLEMAGMTTFLVMPEYETTLEKWIIEQKRQYPLPPFGVEEWEYLLIIYQLLCGVHHLITNGVVHRDIKASNILKSSWEVVIADFGLARRVIKSADSAGGKNKQEGNGAGLDKNKVHYTAASGTTHSLPGNTSSLAQQKQLRSTAVVQFVEKSQVYAGNAHSWAPELARWSHSGPPNTTTTQLTLLDIYAKSDTFAIGRMFFNLLREPLNSSPNGSSWNDDFPSSSVAKPHYSDNEIPELPPCYSNSLQSLLKNMVLNEPAARKETLTLIHIVGLMLWGPSSDMPLTSVDDCCQWLLREQFEMAMCEDNDCSSLSLAGQTLTSQQFSTELKKRFVCDAQPQALWNAYKTLALFSSCF